MDTQQPAERGPWKAWLVVALIGLLFALIDLARDGSTIKLIVWLIVAVGGAVMMYLTRREVWRRLAEDRVQEHAD